MLVGQVCAALAAGTTDSGGGSTDDPLVGPQRARHCALAAHLSDTSTGGSEEPGSSEGIGDRTVLPLPADADQVRGQAEPRLPGPLGNQTALQPLGRVDWGGGGRP